MKMAQAMEEMAAKQICLLPNTEEEAQKIKMLSEQQPLVVFDRMRELLAELTFLTDVVEDAQFEENQEVLEVLMEDYTQLFELVMSRGLVVEDDEAMGSPQDLPSLPRDSPGMGKGGQLGKMTNLKEISK